MSFWVVWNPDQNAPRYRHASEVAAIGEAERLARMNPGQRFFVLEAIALRSVDSMQRVNLREPHDEIPF